MRFLQESPPVWFISAKRIASVIQRCYWLDYDLGRGQFNPAIIERFLSEMDFKSGDVLWEPFAGHLGENRTINICNSYGVNLLAYDIVPVDDRIVKADSTNVSLSEQINGLIFHPPYFTTNPMSLEKEELSLCNEEKYLDGLKRTIKTANTHMTPKGKVCVVGRTVKVFDKSLHLEWIFTKMFLDLDYQYVKMYNSVPDWIVILEKEHGKKEDL